MAKKEHKQGVHLQPQFLMDATVMVGDVECLIAGVKVKSC
jgi:hypothetical protein